MKVIKILSFLFLISTFAHSQSFLPNEAYIKVTKAQYLSMNVKSIGSTENSVSSLFKGKVKVERLLKQNDSKGRLKTLEDDSILRMFKVTFSSKSELDSLVKNAKEINGIEYVSLIPIEELLVTQMVPAVNDSAYFSQWGLESMQVEGGWAEKAGTTKIKVAVVDNSFSPFYADMQSNILTGWDMYSDDTTIFIPDGIPSHGLNVASLVGSTTDNSLGLANASNNQADVIPIKTCYGQAYGGIVYGYPGILKAVELGAKMVNCSWGSKGYYSQANQDIINYVHSQGVLVVAAAGNDGDEALFYPASYNHVISVGASEYSGALASFSTYNDLVAIVAPGDLVKVYGSYGNVYNAKGTSFASPNAMSAFSYFMSAFPNVSLDSLGNYFYKTGDPITLNRPIGTVNKLPRGLNLKNAIACMKEGMIDFSELTTDYYEICNNDSILVPVSLIPNYESNIYYHGNKISSNNDSVFFKNTGDYYLKYDKNNCSLIIQKITVNSKQKTIESPLSISKELNYCSGSEFLEMDSLINSINSIPPISKTYNGSTIKYDNHQSWGGTPTVSFNSQVGEIEDIIITITWEKKNLFSSEACSEIDRGGKPYYNEVSFKIKRPDNQIIDLLSVNTFSSGNNNLGTVVTEFKNSSLNSITNSSLPANGIYKPLNNILSGYTGSGNGIWELIANDSGSNDPLCLVGYSVQIIYKQPINYGSAQYKWFDHNCNLVSDSTKFEIGSLPIGEHIFYSQITVPDLCPGPKTANRVKIKPVGDIVALFDENLLLSTSEEALLLTSKNLSINFDSISLEYNISGIDASSSPFQFPFASQIEAFNNEVVLCSAKDVKMYTLDCPKNVVWSDATLSPSISLPNHFSTVSYSSSCGAAADWSCPLPASRSIKLLTQTTNSPLILPSQVINSSNLKETGSTINSSQQIVNGSDVQYVSSESVTLNPGFEVDSSSTFIILLNNCTN